MPRKRAKPRSSPREAEAEKVSIYPAWCKRCGNCVAFCPREVLQEDRWGYPYVARPDRCISCRVCEMLCPDFAISVGESEPGKAAEEAAVAASRPTPGSPLGPRRSPERLAPEPVGEEESDG